ncbi:hypothetical protein PSE10B_14150 [Pseudomonas amygdali pv. eriobotryae]|nr:hypothetical protein PSE10B_14150 [Pseudomonas amygdali pv. eriobotryae]
MWVAKQMGHTDWTMIARVYGRWMPHADIQAGTKAETLWQAGLTYGKDEGNDVQRWGNQRIK